MGGFRGIPFLDLANVRSEITNAFKRSVDIICRRKKKRNKEIVPALAFVKYNEQALQALQIPIALNVQWCYLRTRRSGYRTVNPEHRVANYCGRTRGGQGLQLNAQANRT